MRNQTLLQTTHTQWPLSTRHCSPDAQRGDADPTDANTLLITRTDSANGNTTANSVTIQNYLAGQIGLELPGMAQRDKSCYRWQQRIAPKKSSCSRIFHERWRPIWH
jgi:isocitrate lyase